MIADAQWLAILARAGLLTGGFVPPTNVRALRLIARQLQKLTGILAGEKNRVHKVLTDGLPTHCRADKLKSVTGE